MNVPASVKPAVWGAIGGAIAAIVIGFAWGGWVTGGTAGKIEAGWVDNVSEQYRAEVATACASTLVEGMEAEPTAKPPG
jgi:hypothetical protein